MEEHYTVCQHSMPFEWPNVVFLVFRNILLILLWSLVAWIPPLVLLPVPEYSCHWLSGNICLNFIDLFGECVVYPLFWLLFGFNIHKWNPRFITCYLYDVTEIHCHLCGITLKSWSRYHSLQFVLTHEHFQNPSYAKLVTAQTAIISQRRVCEICGNSSKSSEIVKCHLSQILWSTLWTRSNLGTADHALTHVAHVTMAA
jgi:hypothetical protein